MMQQKIDKIEEIVKKSSLWESFLDFLNMNVYINQNGSVKITIGLILLIIIIYSFTTIVLNFISKVYSKHLPEADKGKFMTVFTFARWFIYIIVLLVVFDTVGIKVTAIFAASAALLIGIGLALQTLFQDLISGISILVDQSLHVGDIIEIDDKIGRVVEITLRSTRIVTIDNKIVVIPNHLYLVNNLYNWTQNGSTTLESIEIGVGYNSDLDLVKKLLKEATIHPDVTDPDKTIVLFKEFGESTLRFEVLITFNDSFTARYPKSDIRFKIDELFRKNNITIPFPQRDIHIIDKKN